MYLTLYSICGILYKQKEGRVGKAMTRKKSLLIGNSDRYYNLRLTSSKPLEDKIKITKLNEEEIEEDMDVLANRSRRIPLKDNKAYILYQEKFTNDRLIDKVINHGGKVTYYTDTVAPVYVIKGLSMRTSSEVIYSMRKQFTKREVENVMEAFKATEVKIDVPIVVPDMSPYDILFALHTLKTNVDAIQLSFPPLHEEEIQERHKKYYTKKGDGLYHLGSLYKFRFFKYIQTSLSTWAMHIHIICFTQEEYEGINKYVQKDLDKRNPNRNKGGEDD